MVFTMPIYGFGCSSCGHAFDKLQRMNAPDPTECPVCKKATLARQVSAPRFRLAGTGWYETDFKKSGEAQRNLAGDAGAPPSRPRP